MNRIKFKPNWIFIGLLAGLAFCVFNSCSVNAQITSEQKTDNSNTSNQKEETNLSREKHCDN